MNNVAFIIPTGLGCSIGGHAGDATPAAKLIAQTCDKLILHPNVVNASDINEMPENSLYVEGSQLNSFLNGDIQLQETSGNRILVVVNPPLKPETENAINAARSTIGAKIDILVLDTPLIMKGWISYGRAKGEVSGLEEMFEQLDNYSKNYDALGIASPINVGDDIALEYFQNSENCVNPWGGIEAIVSKQVAEKIKKPVAHAPIECDDTKDATQLFELLYHKVVDPRKAAEICSNCYIHCILKGLHKAPRIGQGIPNDTIKALVTPYGCIGIPHVICEKMGIPIIVVKENKCVGQDHNCDSDLYIYVENYWEAAGYLNCLFAGIDPAATRTK